MNVYRERAHLVAFLASIYPSHIGYSDLNDPEWAVIYVESPEGQLSWHIAKDDMDLFTQVERTGRLCRGWDGHTTEEKYERLDQLTRNKFKQCGSECSEGHRYNNRCRG